MLDFICRAYCLSNSWKHLCHILESLSLYKDFHISKQEDLTEGVSVFRGLILQVFANSQFWSLFSRWSTNFAAVCLRFKSLLKMHWHVPRAMIIKNTVFCYVTPCSLVEIRVKQVNLYQTARCHSPQAGDSLFRHHTSQRSFAQGLSYKNIKTYCSALTLYEAFAGAVCKPPQILWTHYCRLTYMRRILFAESLELACLVPETYVGWRVSIACR
jgi:hypothetical protein